MYAASITLQSLVLGTQILLVAVGLYLVYAASRIIHLAIGAIGAAAAYALYWGIISGWPLWASILLALLVSQALGLVSAYLLEPFAKRREPLLGLLVSFALLLILESLIAIQFGTDGKRLQAGVLATFAAGGVQIDLPGMITLISGIVLAFLAWAVIHFTKSGRLLRGLAENSYLSVSLGVNDFWVRKLTYCLAAGVGGLIVILTGWHTALTPYMGFQLVVSAFIALLLGGVGDLRGTILASYLIALVPGWIIGFSAGLSENWRLVIVFLMAAAVLALRPQGLFGRRLREA